MFAPSSPIAKTLKKWTHPDKKRVYFFYEGTIKDKSLLGSKGANLCEMFKLGVPVPPGFIVSTETSIDFYNQKDSTLFENLLEDYKKGVHEIEKQTGRMFSGVKNLDQANISYEDNPMPLLLSVRSSAAQDMPGVMETILNLGMNEEVASLLANSSKNPRFAYDSYRRFLEMFGQVVLYVDKEEYEKITNNVCKARGVPHVSMLELTDYQSMITQYKALASVPDDPWEQLRMAIEAVFNSWRSPLATKYRDIHSIDPDIGVAVTVQGMVYGNMNSRSGTGIAFTRNPGTGVKEFSGEYLSNAEGVEVIAGVRAPMTLHDLRSEQPGVFESLQSIEKLLEHHYKDMQEIEFTVENGYLYILETRAGKRSACASVKIATDLVAEKLINPRDALLRVDPYQMDFFLNPMIDPLFAVSPEAEDKTMGKGMAASAGAISGHLVFSYAEAQEYFMKGSACILCREEMHPVDDLAALKIVSGVITLRGGVSSFAAVAARSMGKPAVIGAVNMKLDASEDVLVSSNGKMKVKWGDVVTIDGSSGMVFCGACPTMVAARDPNYQQILAWANKYKRMHVLADVASASDMIQSLELGASGFGQFRTEHMFLNPDRLRLFRQALLTDSAEQKASSLHKLRVLQQQDFLETFRQMSDRVITIRLLDLPLHDFLPCPSVCVSHNPHVKHRTHVSEDYASSLADLSVDLAIPQEEVKRRSKALHDGSAHTGFRGARVAVVRPEIAQMQAHAIIGAAFQANAEGCAVRPQIAIPLICSDHELDVVCGAVRRACSSAVSDLSSKNTAVHIEYAIGCMLEVPRACIRANAIASKPDIDFVMMDTERLTGLMFGYGPDDADRFMPTYLEKHILNRDPFVSIDLKGVGTMVHLAVNKCKKADAGVAVGVCGEHAGDPYSIHFFEKLRLDYISCPPHRVPMAKIAAAQAHIEDVIREEHLKSSKYWAILGPELI